MAEQSVCFLLPCCSLPESPFPVKSLCFSENSFPSIKQKPTPGPWEGVPLPATLLLLMLLPGPLRFFDFVLFLTQQMCSYV